MHYLLAVETSVIAGGVALFEGDRMLRLDTFDSRTPASARLVPAIKTLLEQENLTLQDLDAFAVSIGPGSFTGLRVGLTAVKTLASFLEKPVIPVPTLMALALGAGKCDVPVGAILDARKGEVYGAYFSIGPGVTRLTEDRVLPVEAFIEAKPGNRICLVGNGLREYRDRIDATGADYTSMDEAYWEPSPEQVGSAAIHLDLERIEGSGLFSLTPVYIRRSEAEIHWRKRK